MSTPGVAVPGTVVPVSSLVSPGGAQGQGGLSAYNLTTAAFTVPAVGSTATVTLGDTSWCAVGESVYVAGAGGSGQAAALTITNISGNTLTLLNPTPPGTIPPASTSGPGLLTQVSGLQTDYVGGDNACHPLATALPTVSGWTKYNAIRNPEMLVIQRGAGPSALSGNNYSIDGWVGGATGGAIAINWSQILVDIPADTSGNKWYPHIQYAYRVTFTTGKPTLAAADAVVIYQYVEGNLAAPLKDNPTSLSLLVRALIPGTFAIALRSSDSGYSYVTTATIPTGNVWTRIPLPNLPVFPAAGNFPSGNAHCYDVLICPAMGPGHTNSAPTLNSWISGNYWGSGTITNFAAANNNWFDFTLVYHEPNAVCTPYVRRDLPTETTLSLRYLWYPAGAYYLGWVQQASWTYEMGRIMFPTIMRATPALMAGSIFTVSSGNAGAPALANQNAMQANIYNGSSNWTANAWVSFNGGFTAEL